MCMVETSMQGSLSFCSMMWHLARCAMQKPLWWQVAPTPEDLDWLEDNALLLHLRNLRMPGASLSQQGEGFVRTLLQFSAAQLTSLDLRQVTASSGGFLEGLPQRNALHTLNLSGGFYMLCLPTPNADVVCTRNTQIAHEGHLPSGLLMAVP